MVFERYVRLKDIGGYISKANSIFPNSIIINLSLRNNDESKNSENEDDLKKYIKVYDDEIDFDEKYVVANIIDGQHRLGGFEYTDQANLDKYEMIVTIMIGLEPAQQAELFGTINGKQKSVNKSVLYDLSAMTENEYTVSVTAHLITTWFNISEKSPLYNKIKMLGVGEGTISQAAMIESLVPLMKKKNIKISKEFTDNMILPIFLREFNKKNSKKIIKQLYDYFKCFKEIFPEEWEYEMKNGDKNKYILNKTTGITGILIAYTTIYCYQYYNSDFSYRNLYSLISKLKEKDMDFSSQAYIGGSKQLQKNLAVNIILKIFNKEEIVEFRNNFISECL